MNQQSRPSINELTNKIREAISLVATGGKFFFANDAAAMAEIRSEGFDVDEIEDLILQALREIQPAHYKGGRPPMASYEDKIKGSGLFPFVWDSVVMGKKMYLKFVIKNGCFYYVSFHKDRRE